MAFARIRPTVVGQELKTALTGQVVQWRLIIISVAEEIAAAIDLRDQLPRHDRFMLMERGDLPSFRQATVGPNRVQFIAFSTDSGAKTKPRIGVFRAAADEERLTIHDREKSMILAVAQRLLQHPPEKSHSHRIGSTSEHACRRQLQWLKSSGRPVLPFAGPAPRTIMQRGPQHQQGNRPRLIPNTLLMNLSTCLPHQLVQFRPEFAFHS